MRQAEMTSADVHDMRRAEAVIQGDEEGYFADKADDSQAFRQILRSCGFVDGVAHRGNRAEEWMEEIERQASRRFTTAERAGRREIHCRLAPNSRRCQPVSELPPVRL